MEERATIARELHDSLAQVLSYLRIQLTLLKRAIPEDNAGAQSIMADFSRALNDAYRQLRELLTTFRLTLQQADLPSALHEMLEDLQSQTPAKLTLDCRLPTLALDAQMQVHLLQIVREAVLNAIKHANASEIAVSCVTAPDGDHTVYIRDNGIGIGEPHEPAGHYGLNIMRERAERLGGTLNFFRNLRRRHAGQYQFSLLQQGRESVNVKNGKSPEGQMSGFPALAQKYAVKAHDNLHYLLYFSTFGS